MSSRGKGHYLALSAVVLLALQPACAGDPPLDPFTAASVTVTPTDPSVAVSGTLQLSATALNERGDAIGGKTFTWSSSDESVATVDGDGLVTGTQAGSATITARTDGVDGTVEVTVTAGLDP